MPDEKIYSVLLKTTNCIVPVDEGYQAFLLQDFDGNKKTLKVCIDTVNSFQLHNQFVSEKYAINRNIQ